MAKKNKLITNVLENDKDSYKDLNTVKEGYEAFMLKEKGFDVTYDNFYNYFIKVFPEFKGRKKINSVSATKTKLIKEVEEAEIELKVFNPKKTKINDEIFTPLKTGKFIDNLISKLGGFMPGTTTVMHGEPGTGKTTIALDSLYCLIKKYPKKEFMSLSSEMTRIDLQSEEHDKEWMKDIKHILFSDYEKVQYKKLIEKVVLYGYEFLVIDSFQNIVDRLTSFCGMTSNSASNFLIELFKNANEGKTETGHCTCILVIQQETKGGDFAGKNSIMHDTTAMLELRHDNTNNERFAFYSKNRRNGHMIKKKLYYTLTEKHEIKYEEEKWKEDREREEILKRDSKRNQEMKDHFEKTMLEGKKNLEEDEEMEAVMEEVKLN